MTSIVDEKGNPVPIGVAGELYIGGAGVTNGYLNRPTLTGQKYIKNTGSDPSSTHWYKTGDLVRFLPNGDIDFLGRMDHQVKIRGFRIELGEIEAKLNEHPAIQQSVVTVFSEEGTRKELVAYYIPKENPPLEADLKNFLKNRLPGYMVPSLYMQMDSFPQNTALKTDRKALPKPSRNKLVVQQKNEYVLPTTKLEKKLSSFWMEVLKVDQVGINSDFFDMGGHSLIAVELLSKIFKETGTKLSISCLFQNSTIQKQAALIEKTAIALEEKMTALVPIRAEGNKPPLYLIHGGGFDVTFYQCIVRYMDSDQPIYALQAIGLDGKHEPLESVEEMAAHYIGEILEQNPEGPFHLAGYSLGGTIAYEMARQLKAMNKAIGVVGLFDAVIKEEWADHSNFEKFIKKMGHNFSNLLKKPIDTIEYKSGGIRQKYKNILGKIKLGVQQTSKQELFEEYLPGSKKVYDKCMEAYQKYDLQPDDIEVILFRAKDQMFYIRDPEFLSWKEFALKGVKVYEVAGNHLSMFETDPKTIATTLQENINEISNFKESITGKA